MVKRIGTIGGRVQPIRDERTLTKDGLVLGAIALVSVAFGVGLYDQMGINVVLAVTLAAAGFFVLFSLHYIIVQLSSSESMAPRISSLERVVARLARDMAQIEDMSKEVAEFRRTCERIDQAHSQLELGGYGESAQVREEAVQQISHDVRRLDGQIRALRNYFDHSNQENKEHMKSELQAIESHVKNVASTVMLQAPEKSQEQPNFNEPAKFNSPAPNFPPVLAPAAAQSPLPNVSFDNPPMPLFDALPHQSQSQVAGAQVGGPQIGAQIGNQTPSHASAPLAPLTPNYAANFSDTPEFEFKPLTQEPPQVEQHPVTQNQVAQNQATQNQVTQNQVTVGDMPFKPQPLSDFSPVPLSGSLQNQVPFTPSSVIGDTHQNGVYLPTSAAQQPNSTFFFEDSQAADTPSEEQLLHIIRQAISSNRMDLFLQPIVSLPERNVAFYEALTRLKDEAGELIHPPEYLDIAKRQGIMPVIDNVMLYRSVQVIRKLLDRGSARGLFCNLSSSSLMDKEFFPEFLNFMEKNKDLASTLFFDIDQSYIDKATQSDLDKLASLARIGYRISLDNVSRLDLDFGELQRRGVRFMKIDAHILLHGMEQAGARIHAADMQTYLKRYGIELIASKIENEEVLNQLLSYNIQFGQGFLFSDPRPVRPEIFKKGSSQQAA